jgi:hypothetical protein
MALDSIRRSMEYSQATSPATAERPPAGEASTAGTLGPAGEASTAGTLGPGDEAPAGTMEGSPGSPGFGARGRMRRRARFLRKARELAYRDLGGLVYSLHRFGQRNDGLVLAKLETITRIDNELRGLESALAEHQPVTVLREAGVAACPRCAAIHGSDDRFCPNCGLAMDPRAERPVAGAAAPAQAQPPSALAGTAPPPTQPPIQPPIQPRATPAPAKASESSEGAADERGLGKAGTSVDESTEIIRPPIGSS